MKIKIEQEFSPVRLIVKAGVRYWEDANVNGEEDAGGTRIPFRDGEYWNPVIMLSAGRIMNWPAGMTANIHYKVCDDGEYWLEDANGVRLKWNGDYVPSRLLCHGDNGYGDYIIFSVHGDGKILKWEMPELDGNDWNMVGK